MTDEPHEFVKRQMVSIIYTYIYVSILSCTSLFFQAYGSAESSFTSRFLESRNVSPDEEFDIKWSAASLYSGGADTVSSGFLLVLKLANLCYSC